MDIGIEQLSALFTVVLIDLALAGDNAIIIGVAAAGLAAGLRKRAIFIGIVCAAVMRIILAYFALSLLEIIGLMLAGGILLLWVSWKLWREIHTNHKKNKLSKAHNIDELSKEMHAPKKSFREAVFQILLADISMSLDNVLAVAGAAREHPSVIIFGLALSVALMGFAASFVATLINKYAWISYLGLAIIFYVAVRMIVEGAQEVAAVI